MIDKIEISISDSGQFIVKGGCIVIEYNKIDALKWVNEFMKDLAYFPQNTPNEIVFYHKTIDQFINDKKRSVKNGTT